MNPTFLRWLVPFVVSGAALAAPQDSPAAEPEWWNTFRGPDGNCVSHTGNPPIEWSEDKNVKWKVPLPGLGSSSPIVWGDRVYVTTAIETDREGEAQPERPTRRPGRRGGRGNAPAKVYEFAVLAFDREDGDLVWQTKVNECVPHEGHHPTASFASNSPLTDGKLLWAFFGSRGLHCLDLDGEVLWSKDLGQMRTKNRFGEGASPALYHGTLIVPWDHEGDSRLYAFDARTGKERWHVDRDESTSWSSPVVVEVGKRAQIVVAATEASRSYDFETGKLVWECSGMTNFCVPTPPHADGLLYLMSGFSGAVLQAVRLEGAKGDIEGTEHIAWTHGKSTSYTPSALLQDGLLYFCRVNSGILSCLDAATGEVCYEDERLQGLRDVYSSPVGAAGRVYVTSRQGVTKVIQAGREFKELATNELDDGFDATAAIVGDEMYLRGMKNLYCLAEQQDG